MDISEYGSNYEESDYMKCPYNYSHFINKHKFHSHLQKCLAAKRSPEKLIFCKRNTLIWYFPGEKQKHFEYCSSCNPQLKYILNESQFLDSFPESKIIKYSQNQNNDISLSLDISRLDQSAIPDIDEFKKNLPLEESQHDTSCITDSHLENLY